MPKLVVFRGDAVENEFRLAGHTVTIGRDNSNDIVLDDSLKGVSRFHAEVRAEAGTYVIADLKSRNGVWMNGRRIDEKAELGLGVPVTLGAYELVLEDDVPSGEFVAVPPPIQPTVVTPASVEADRPALAATRAGSKRSLVTAPNRQALLWSAGALAVLVVCGVTFAVVRHKAPAAKVDVVDPSSLATAPLPPPGLPEIVDPREKALKEHLAAARKAIDDRDFSGALRTHVLPVLAVIAQLTADGIAGDFEPERLQALDLKKEAEAGMKSPTPPPPPPPPTPPAGPDCPERPLIPRRSNESCAEYNLRSQGIIVNFQEGNRYLLIPDFANALVKFRLVDAAQKGYRGVDAIITETLDKQRKAVAEAIDGGGQNEVAGKFIDALTWYQRGMASDPGSTALRDKYTSLLNRMTEQANKLSSSASLNKKLGNKETARKQFEEIVNLMPAGNEIRLKAEKELEAVKR